MNSDISQALVHIPADDRDLWVKIGMAIKSELGDAGFATWDAWSQSSGSYKAKDARTVWRSFKRGPVAIGTLFHIAGQNGYRPPKGDRPPKPKPRRQYKQPRHIFDAETRDQTRNTKRRAGEIWELATPAYRHEYLTRKGVQPHGARILGPEYKGAPKAVQGDGSLLIIPMQDIYGEVWSVQFINEGNPPIKRYLAGKKKRDTFYRIGAQTRRVWLVEGFATGASLFEDTGDMVYIAFDAGGLLPVARIMMGIHPGSNFAIMADDDWHTVGNPGLSMARKVCNTFNHFDLLKPDFEGLNRGPKHTDYNDVAMLRRRANG